MGLGFHFSLKRVRSSAAELTELRQAYGVNYTACSNTMKTMHEGDKRRFDQ